MGEYGCYFDSDDDGICYCIILGIYFIKGFFFICGILCDEYVCYIESGEVYVCVVNCFLKKWFIVCQYVF